MQHLVTLFFFFNFILQQVGFDKCVAVLGEMVIQAKKDANIDPAHPLESLVSNNTLVSDWKSLGIEISRDRLLPALAGYNQLFFVTSVVALLYHEDSGTGSSLFSCFLGGGGGGTCKLTLVH